MPLTDVKVTEETPENVVLDLSGHLLDGYAPMRPPVYSLEFVSDTENITLELAGTVVNVTRLAENYTGNVSVRVNCTNLHGLVVSSNTFRIITTNVDDAPIWLSTPPPVEVEEDGKATTDYSLYDHVFDVENDTIRFSAQATDGMEVEVTETGNLRLTPPKDYYGNGIISITARELTGDGLSIGITIPFNIIAVNDPPVAVGANSTLNMPEDGVRYVNISGLFSDVDDAELMNVAVSENPRVDAAVLPNSSLRLTPERDWSGVTIVNLWAVDPSGDTGTARITLFVEEVNDPPECSIIVRTSGVGPGYGSSRIEGTGSDVDGSIAEYLWTSSLDGVLGDAPALNLSSLPLTAGTHLINFSVMDDDGAWSPVKSMLVDVGRPLVEVNRFSIPGMAAEGDEVILGMTLKNAGNAEARDLKVRFVVNGELLDEAEIGYLFPGEEVNVEIPWTPSPGEHSIEAEVEAPDGTSIVVLGDIVLAGSLTVEDDTSYAYPLLSIAATLAVIIAMLVLGRAIRRRRRRQALNELGTIIRDAGKRGVAVGDCRDIHKGLKKRFY